MTKNRSFRDAGTLTLSTAIVVPGIIMLLALAIMIGRIAVARGVVELVAYEAARAASISCTVANAAAAARAAADTITSVADLSCTTLEVSTDLAALKAPVGQTGQVSVAVECTVTCQSWARPTTPSPRTATSVVDPYRSR